MKGPYQRLKYDLRRLWECPVCQHRAHTHGDVTTVLCRCQQQVDPAARRYMHLIEITPRRIQITAVAAVLPVAAPEITAPEITAPEITANLLASPVASVPGSNAGPEQSEG